MFTRLLCQLAVSIALTAVPFALQANSTPDISDDISLTTSQYNNAGHSLFFTENKGQWDVDVLFKANGTGGGLTWFIERDGFTVLFSVPDSIHSQKDSQQIKQIKQMGYEPFDDLSASSAKSAVNKTLSHALKFKFRHALPRVAGNFLREQTTPASANSVESSERLSWNTNYFLGSDESKWAPDCGNYERVTLKNVWRGLTSFGAE